MSAAVSLNHGETCRIDAIAGGLCPPQQLLLRPLMVRSSSQMDNSILFAELLELVRFEDSSAVSYDCMRKSEMREILLQEYDS